MLSVVNIMIDTLDDMLWQQSLFTRNTFLPCLRVTGSTPALITTAALKGRPVSSLKQTGGIPLPVPLFLQQTGFAWCICLQAEGGTFLPLMVRKGSTSSIGLAVMIVAGTMMASR